MHLVQRCKRYILNVIHVRTLITNSHNNSNECSNVKIIVKNNLTLVLLLVLLCESYIHLLHKCLGHQKIVVCHEMWRAHLEAYLQHLKRPEERWV